MKELKHTLTFGSNTITAVWNSASEHCYNNGKSYKIYIAEGEILKRVYLDQLAEKLAGFLKDFDAEVEKLK